MNLRGRPNGSYEDARNLIFGGFAAVLVLICALGACGYYFLREVNNRLETIVNEHVARTDAIYRMNNLMALRSLAVNSLLAMSDPFERDQEFMRFNALAEGVVMARETLEALRMDEADRKRVREILGQIRQLRAIQERVVDFAMAGRVAEAQRLQIRDYQPLREHVSQNFLMLVEVQNRAAQRARDAAETAYRTAVGVSTVIAVLILVLSALIAGFVRRRIGNMQHQLYQENERAHVTLGSIGDGVISTDADGRIEYMNPVAERLTGVSRETARGLPLEEVYRPVTRWDREPIPQPVAGPLHGPACPTVRDAVLVTEDGGYNEIEDISSPLHAEDGSLIGAVVVTHDVTEARALSRQLYWAATHDALTGLFNRAEFERRLKRLITSGRRMDQESALLFLDLDRFKQVNDEGGHAAGDELLRRITALFGERIRDSDTLARLGGDEFAIILAGCPLPRAESIAEDLRKTVETLRFMHDGKLFSVGVSIGVVALGPDKHDLEDALAAADAAMYEAKNHGRNRVVSFGR